MKAVLISIRPEWCEKIASGEKTMEIRKTRPKLEPPFKVYIYCTKNTKKNALHTYIRSGYGRKTFGIIEQWRSGKEVVDVNAHLPAYRYNAYLAEGKVIGEFVCDKIDYWQYNWNSDVMHICTMSELSCVSVDDLLKYLDGTTDQKGDQKRLYAWHISDLVIYEKPRPLSDFKPPCDGFDKRCQVSCAKITTDGKSRCTRRQFTRPPQSWCYVEEVTP